MGDLTAPDVMYIPETDDWLATIVLPLKAQLAGSDAILSARIDLHRLQEIIAGNPFAKTGVLTVVDRNGHQVLDPKRQISEASPSWQRRWASCPLAPARSASNPTPPGRRGDAWRLRVPAAVPLGGGGRAAGAGAYLAVAKMTRSLLWWGVAGLAVAVLGAVALSIAISRPILEIDRAAAEVGRGNFAVRVVRGLRQNDEIGDLARRMNEMIVGLAERFHLERFVSGGTMAAIRISGNRAVELGGTRQRATMLFCDIRGYTEFAERHEPAMVVEVLNFYFQHLAELVKAHQGDIDKFVGDQILAVFAGEAADARAIRCALAMQAKMAELGADRPSWNLRIGIGVNTGEVIMGAMGSRERMDYTVLGDAVNVAARLCSQARSGQTLVTRATLDAAGEPGTFTVEALAPIQLKGKREPVGLYDVRGAVVAEAVHAPS